MTDATLRFLITFGLLGVFFTLEALSPARQSNLSLKRFFNQAGMAAISAVLARLALAGGLTSVAMMADRSDIGIFNLFSFPKWLAIGLSFFVLDLAIWGQHWALHHLPFLWRLHRVHHGDTIMDVSTAFRFHPFEILTSLAFKAAIIISIGAPPVAVLVFEIALGAGALFTHANIALPHWLERWLRFALVTPALHLIHHSPNLLETNCNFGFSFNFWDRLFGTFRATPMLPNGPIGLETRRGDADQKLSHMLVDPFL